MWLIHWSMIWTLVLFVLDAVEVLSLNGFQICLPLFVPIVLALIGSIFMKEKK
jgi:hypothetical protein